MNSNKSRSDLLEHLWAREEILESLLKQCLNHLTCGELKERIIDELELDVVKEDWEV